MTREHLFISNSDALSGHRRKGLLRQPGRGLAAKRLLQHLAAALVLLAVTASCGRKLSVQPSEISAEAVAGDYSVAVTGNTAWTADCDAEWLTLAQPASGTGNDTVTVRLAENTAPEPRTATLSVRAGGYIATMTVTQAAAAPDPRETITLTLTPSDNTVTFRLTATDITVDWGDSSTDDYDEISNGDVTHTYVDGTSRILRIKAGELSTLSCKGQQITALDVSKSPSLTWLDCSYNRLSELDVSYNAALRRLDCGRNLLNALDISMNTALIHLECFDNRLEALDVSNSMALTRLDCYNNQLNALDVSRNAALSYLICWSNRIEALDVSHNTALRELDCGHNRLSTVNISKNRSLKRLNCSASQVKTITVSKRNTALTEIFCYSNQLSTVALNKLFEDLPDRSGIKAKELRIGGNPGTSACNRDKAIAKSWIIFQ
jgi:hypothetical protein